MRRFSITIIFPVIGFFFSSYFSPFGNCDQIPELNKQILAFVKTKINKKVGRGECWDLASEALNSVGAKWDHDFEFGKIVNPKSECIFPGDIMQFEGVELDYRKGNTIYHEDLAHHTAIIYEVKTKGSFMLAQQNTNTGGKKVSLEPFDMSSVSKGQYKIFRPVK